MSHTATHVYAVVRIKVLGTSSAGESHADIATNIADAIAAKPEQWMSPVHGSVRTTDGGSFDIEEVEFADAVNWVLVDEIDDESGKVTEHHFDHGIEPMTDKSGFTTALEATLTEKIGQIEAENARLARQLVAALRIAPR